jgi:hypothetical protein
MLVAGVLTVLAYNHDGSPIQDVELNDGGVWVTNPKLQMMARLNSQVRELDMGIITTATSDDVFQEGASVQVFDDGGGGDERTLRVANPLDGTVSEPVVLSDTHVASAARDTVAILDRETGEAWLRRADQLADLSFDTAPPDVEVSERSTVVVSKNGTVLLADRSAHTVTSYRLDATGLPVEQEAFEFDSEFTDDVELTAVGDVPVALDRGKVLRPGEDPVAVAGDGPVLQAVGPEDEHVHLATEDGLWRVPLSGGGLDERTEVDAGGAPAPPVVVAGCVHAAWTTPGKDNYQRQCGDDAVTEEIRPLSTDGQLVFRTNRDVVVINDVANGGAWLVEETGLTLVDNWPSVNPNAKDPQVAQASDRKSTTKRNKPPTAVDDEFGARPGATVVLPVTLNDVDPDGDILTLTGAPASTQQVTYSVTGGGTQVQARLSEDVKGSVSFEYEISDGHPANPPSTATVSLRIFGKDVDRAPALIEGQKNQLTVARGHEASVNVLPAWIDPEGDSVVLTAATSDGGEVGFRPDGTVDFRDNGDGGSAKTVKLVVRGGDATTSGTLDVKVVDPEKSRPEVVADRFTGPVGSTILLEPLANDRDPLGGQLRVPRLQVVSAGAAPTVAKDSELGTATFRASQPGAYFLEYEATSANGQSSDTAVIRVDVARRADNNRPPVAARDLAAVRADGSVLVDVLANDIDPDGDVMVVQGIEVPPQWQDSVTASLINKRFARVEVSGELPEGEKPEFDYLLSDGVSDQVRGTVSVALADVLSNRPPVAREDQVTVRAGTIVTIPVLDNDDDPDGDSLSIRQQDLFDLDPHTRWVAEGTVPIVATGSGIRVMVPDDGTTELQVGYGVRDQKQARADSRLVLNIQPDDPDNNRAPEPRPIEDRTVSGQKIRVPVDIFGADPDGDPVVYTGVIEPPAYGRIVRAGAGWFEYEPFEGTDYTGTDEFKVQVSDPYGAQGTADVRIGVAARSAVNQAPAALDDQLLVKPGLTIQYPVMQNDSDPDGDPLSLEADEFSAPPNVDAQVVDTFVEMRVPALGKRTEASASALYAVTDELGSSSEALLTVTAREDAPDHAPLASDDVVSAEQMAGKQAGDTVDVDVLENDGDLDGSKSALELEAVGDHGAEVTDRMLRITLEAEGRVVPYRITDATDQPSFGFVYVAGTENMPPQLDTAAVPVEVVAGKQEEIELSDVVIVRDGRSPKVARTDQITEANGEAEADGLEKLLFRAPRTYHGPASITLGVIDGEDLNDPTGLQSQITIPITVKPAGNVPPEVRSTSVVVYAGGDGETVDLDRLATDANDDDLTFEVTGDRAGVEASVEDDVLTVTASDEARNGEVELEVAASDGDADPQTGSVLVTVIGGSTTSEKTEEARPPMQLVDLRVADGVAGKAERIDVRDAIAFDPYPGEPKEVTWAVAEGPAGRPAIDGSTVVVTPDGAGEVVVTYRLADGSGKNAREAEGRIVIVVADVPEAPGVPTAVEGGPDSVQLTWRAPDDRGSPITHYLVNQVGSRNPRECVATQCTVENLEPGKDYRFTVTAVNGIGPGEPSVASAPVTPDTVPETMKGPVVATDDHQDRDKQLHLSWTPGQSEGSKITGYQLQSNPATTLRTVGPDQTSMTWPGLENGTTYSFQIRAVNARGEGEWSAWSSGEVPFTRPSPMSPPTLVSAGNDDGSGNGYVKVSWPEPQAPANGYDAVSGYEVQLHQDGKLLHTMPATTTSTDFTVANGHEYTATVRATNRAGWGERSDPSAAEITWDRASKVTAIRKVKDCYNCTTSTSSYRALMEFTTPSDNGGYPVTKYVYRTSDGFQGTILGATEREGAVVQLTMNFNGPTQNQSVTLTPYTSPPGEGERAGEPSTGGDFDPYAKPKVAAMEDLSGYRQVKVRFTCDGNGRPVRKLDLYRYGAADTAVPPQECSPTNVQSWSPMEGGDAICLESTVTTVAGSSATQRHPCAHADPVVVTVRFIEKNATGSCSAPCYRIAVSAEGLLQGSWPMTASASGSSSTGCNGSSFSRESIYAGADGRGSENPTWFIEGACGRSTTVTVTIDGKHRNHSGSNNLP